MNGSELTAEDYAAVLGAMQSLSATYGARTLNEALSQWRLTVIDLEEGFDTEWIWEYHNELVCRDWLHAAWPLLTPRVREVRQAELDEWDRRFVAATLPRRKADGLPAGMDGRWWHDRYPRRITGERGHDLPPGWSPAPVHADDD
ncbi:hypothetical protein H9Y04_27745 [Streptomyces sp. TRM66268-LWL]|uniref:DUF4913 domain-containing protein n=1 Tax=Streptomyces polyasparticus TaxID=2767826 RepID=A0ABR7SNR3_9ACTN|nr:hypothetical protein [Streptomyces polyasparticus]MBC9716335.1 hypothetical protein [Streptomyces polyasparticus]